MGVRQSGEEFLARAAVAAHHVAEKTGSDGVVVADEVFEREGGPIFRTMELGDGVEGEGHDNFGLGIVDFGLGGVGLGNETFRPFEDS